MELLILEAKRAVRPLQISKSLPMLQRDLLTSRAQCLKTSPEGAQASRPVQDYDEIHSF